MHLFAFALAETGVRKHPTRVWHSNLVIFFVGVLRLLLLFLFMRFGVGLKAIYHGIA